MGIPWLDIIMAAAGILVLLFWLTLYGKSRKYDSLFVSLEEKEFPLKELYSTGYAFMEMTHYRYKSKRDRKLRQEIAILYGEKYTEFYLRVLYAQQACIGWLVFVFAFIMYGLTQEIGVWAIMVMFSGLAVYYYGTAVTKKIQKRAEEMLRDFSEAVSKLALLTNAGMILREAWIQVAETGEGVLYDEMKKAVEDMGNGVSEAEAIRQFGIRCMNQDIKKFASTIVQGLTSGNRELTRMLQEQSKEMWYLRKQDVKRQGEKAASKLIIPLMLMLIGILIMIMVPIFSNLGM